jgi:hypothetical protein
MVLEFSEDLVVKDGMITNGVSLTQRPRWRTLSANTQAIAVSVGVREIIVRIVSTM